MNQSPGGKRLRALREFYGKTQLTIELDANLGIGYLQRLELGKVQQPERDTLDRILTALQAQYTERREVLELFGYIVDAPIPTPADIEWAISVCQIEIQSAMFPAYLLDCAHRLLFWNPLVLKLFEYSPQNNPFDLHQISMLKMVFEAAFCMTSRIKNTDIFFPAQIRALRYEMQRFHEEVWYSALIQDMLGCAAFNAHWEQEQMQLVHIPARPLTPLEIEVNGQLLSFRLISETFVQDHRFRVIYYLPSDAITTQQCMAWQK